MKTFRFLLTLAGALLLPACLTTYHPDDGSAMGGGFGQTQLKPDVWRVYFRGGPGVSKPWLEAALLYRCAEVTTEAGGDHFLVLESNTVATSQTVTFRQVGDSVRATTSDPPLRAEALITVRHGPAPENDPGAFNAAETVRLLRPKVFNNNPATR